MTEPVAPNAEAFSFPEILRPLFWDCRFEALDWDAQKEFIIGRVLTSGSWEAVRWLRLRAGDDVLRAWISDRQGGPLSAPQLRFWELILGLPHQQVNAWLEQQPRKTWKQRIHR